MDVDLTLRPRTKRVFSEDDMVRMRDLYYDRGEPMTRVAAAFDVPVSTFLRWIAEMDWPRRTSSGPGFARAAMAYPAAPSFPPPGARALPSEGAEHPRGPAVGDKRFAVEVAAAARRELAALGDLAGPVDPGLTLSERKCRADLIASLSRAVARIDRVFEARVREKALRARVKQLERELAERENAPIAALERAVAERALQLARRDPPPMPAPARPRTPAKPDDGKLTLPEYRQWWIDRGKEPP